MRILFLKPKHIGDALMMTPVLAAVRARYPHAEIWVAVRKNTEGILAGSIAIDRLETIDAAPFSEKRDRWSWWHDLKLMLRLRRQKFDMLFELGDGHRARWFCLAACARKTYSVNPETSFDAFWRRVFDGVSRFEWDKRHRVERDYETVREFLPLPAEIPPLMFDRARTKEWPGAAGLRDFAVLHPGTRETLKRWPLERWIEVGRYLLTRFPHVVVTTGPDPRERAEAMLTAKALGSRTMTTDGQADWAQMAGLLYRARLFVGADTAAMHLAAACGVPIVALFGPSREENWRPWQAVHRLVTPPDVAPGLGSDGLRQRRVVDIAPADVIRACDDILAGAPAPAAS